MNDDQQRAWKNEALDVVFDALAASERIRRFLIFKGGRVLHLRLPSHPRQSYDIDAVLTDAFVLEYPERDEQRQAIEQDLNVALARHFDQIDPVRYQLVAVSVTPNPKREHVRGWNAFDARIRLTDNAHSATRGMPTLDLDMVAPELLGEKAIAPMNIDGRMVTAYTLERMAGEKLRAFLTSLPTYRKKFRKPGDAVRIKDIYDLACIVGARPITDVEFWQQAANEFRLACESRLVDCLSIETFEEEIATTEELYSADPTIPKDISFRDAWKAISQVVALLEEFGILPLVTPLDAT